VTDGERLLLGVSALKAASPDLTLDKALSVAREVLLLQWQIEISQMKLQLLRHGRLLTEDDE
jgi:hypothetical protein